MKALKTILPIAAVLILAVVLNAAAANIVFTAGTEWHKALVGELLLSAVPAAVVFIGAVTAERFLKRKLTLFVPPAFFIAWLIPWLSPLIGTNDTFLWYYHAIISSGALGWALIFAIAEYAAGMLRQKKKKQSTGELPRNKQKEK